MDKKKLVIIGGGGLGREVSVWIAMIPEIELLGFFDDRLSAGTQIGNFPVLGGIDDLAAYARQHLKLSVIIAIGNPRLKKKIFTKIRSVEQLQFPSLIHPAAILDDRETITLEEGTIVTAGCILTTGVKIGKHVLLNLAVTIGHDAVVGDFGSIMPGARVSGSVTINDTVLVGTGAVILNNLTIGRNTTIGAGAVVTKNLPPDCTAIGIPAKW